MNYKGKIMIAFDQSSVVTNLKGVLQGIQCRHLQACFDKEKIVVWRKCDAHISMHKETLRQFPFSGLVAIILAWSIVKPGSSLCQEDA